MITQLIQLLFRQLGPSELLLSVSGILSSMPPVGLLTFINIIRRFYFSSTWLHVNTVNMFLKSNPLEAKNAPKN